MESKYKSSWGENHFGSAVNLHTNLSTILGGPLGVTNIGVGGQQVASLNLSKIHI